MQKNNKCHGEGIKVYENGTVQQGVFKNNWFIQSKDIEYPYGKKEQGPNDSLFYSEYFNY